MNAENPRKLAVRTKWWQWPFIIVLAPFAFAAGLFGFAVFFGMIAVCWPFWALQSRRERRHVERKLTEEGRFIRWDDAIARCGADGTGIALELGPKAFGSMWLVELPPEAHASFVMYPTYARWGSDPRGVWTACMELEKSSPQLVANMHFAKRIENPPENLDDLDVATKDSIRIITVFNDASPSALLSQSIRNNMNA